MYLYRVRAYLLLGVVSLVIGPAHAAESTRDRRDTLLRGEALTRQGDHEAALGIWLKLLKDAPNDTQLLLRLGVTQSLLSRYDEAESTFRRAIQLDPGNGQLVYNLALMFFRKGELGKAKKYLNRARTLSPELPGVNEHLAMLSEMQGDTAKARQYYLKAINANVGSLSAWMWVLGRKPDRPRREISTTFAVALLVVCVAAAAGLLLATHHRNKHPGPV